MNPDSLLRGLRIPTRGLSAQRIRMDVISQNLANAGTTRTPEGGPYRRQVAEIRPVDGTRAEDFGRHLRQAELSVADPLHFPFGIEAPPAGRLPGGVEVAGIIEDPSEGPRIYDPSHPDADLEGYVQMPNVDPTTELVDLMMARRLFEANAAAFESMKGVIRRSIDL